MNSLAGHHRHAEHADHVVDREDEDRPKLFVCVVVYVCETSLTMRSHPPNPQKWLPYLDLVEDGVLHGDADHLGAGRVGPWRAHGAGARLGVDPGGWVVGKVRKSGGSVSKGSSRARLGMWVSRDLLSFLDGARDEGHAVEEDGEEEKDAQPVGDFAAEVREIGCKVGGRKCVADMESGGGGHAPRLRVLERQEQDDAQRRQLVLELS